MILGSPSKDNKQHSYTEKYIVLVTKSKGFKMRTTKIKDVKIYVTTEKIIDMMQTATFEDEYKSARCYDNQEITIVVNSNVHSSGVEEYADRVGQ